MIRTRGLPLFPEPLPGEHLWSVVARYHALSANRSPAQTRAQLGIASGPAKGQDIFNRSFASALASVAELLGVSIAGCARQYTLLPIFSLSMSASAMQAWLEAWSRGTLPEASTARPMNWRIMRHDQSWRHCPDCLKDDREYHGVAYWHVVHQTPGLGNCPVHGCRLLGCCARCGRSRSTLHDLQFPQPLCECTPDDNPPRDPGWDTWLSHLISELRARGGYSLESTLSEIRDGFGLPERITGKHEPRLDAILERVELTVGRKWLADFFEFYGSDNGRYRGRARPHLVRATLTDSWRMMRHPLYFLVVLYALDSTSSPQKYTAFNAHSQWDQHAQKASVAAEVR